MATFTPEKEDTLNPGQRDWDNKLQHSSALSDAENSASEDLADNFDASAIDPSSEDANMQGLRNAESTHGQKKSQDNNDKDKGKGKEKNSKLEFKGDKSKLSKQQRLGAGLLKRKGPLGLIAAILLSTGGIFTALTSPGLAIVQIKEALMEDLNDSIPSMDMRNQHIFRAKLKNQTKGFCTKSASARCRYKNMSKRQVEKLRKQGFEVDVKKTKVGRYKVTKLSYTDPTTGRKKTVPPNEFRHTYNNNPHFRGLMNKFYSPRLMSVRDKASESVKKRFKLSFNRIFNGRAKAAMKRQYNNFVKKGGATGSTTKKTPKVGEGEDGKEYKKEDGSAYTRENGEGGQEKPDVDKSEDKIRDLKKKSVSGGVKKMMGGSLRAGLSFSGTQKELCTMLKLLRAAGVLSRASMFIDLMRFAIPLLNTADAIKSGSATPEQTEFLGDIITHEDQRSKVLTEDSLPLDDSGTFAAIASPDTPAMPTDNPHKGDNAFDSAGLKASMYGASPNLDMRESTSKFGGGMGNRFVGLADTISRASGGTLTPSACSFWKSGWGKAVEAGETTAMIVIGIFTFGGGTAVQMARGAAVTMVMMALTELITQRITDMAEGNLFNADSQGLDAGNAYFSGTAAFNSSTAGSRGLSVLSTPDEVKDSQKQALQTKQLYREVDTIAARSTPFDIYNQHSFLGSIAWKLNPTFISSKSTIAGVLSTPITLVSSAVSWMSPTAGAAVATDMSRFEKCDDESYKIINLQSADFMCNQRFGMSDSQANSDPQKIVEWMIDACQIDSESGEVNKSGKCPPDSERKTDPDELASTDGYNAAGEYDGLATTERATHLLNSTHEQVAMAMKYDDTAENSDIAAAYKVSPTAKLANIQLPKNIGEESGDSEISRAGPNDEVAMNTKDVRSYAHYLRYCRFGPEAGEGRNVAIGDADGWGEESALTGLDIEDQNKYISFGKECLASNNCEPGQDPNNTNTGDPGGRPVEVCRPAQYDIYAVFTGDDFVEQGMDAEEGDSSDDSSGLVTGEAKELARKLTEEPNIEFVNPATKEDLLRFADTGEATNSCGEKFAINALLSGIMLTNAQKGYKILVNNFGFQSDRYSCDSGQHPKGNAVDLNGISKDGENAGSTNWGSMTYSGNEVTLIEKYTIDWMNGLAEKEPTRGRVGQLGCGGFNITGKRDPKWQGPDGTLHFDDSCDHLHIDVGDRVDSNKI